MEDMLGSQVPAATMLAGEATRNMPQMGDLQTPNLDACSSTRCLLAVTREESGAGREIPAHR